MAFGSHILVIRDLPHKYYVTAQWAYGEQQKSEPESLYSLSLSLSLLLLLFTVLLWLSPLVINSFASNRSVDLCPFFTANNFRMLLIDYCIDGQKAAAAALSICKCVRSRTRIWLAANLLIVVRHTCIWLPSYFHALATFIATQKLTTTARQLRTQNYFTHKSQSSWRWEGSRLKLSSAANELRRQVEPQSRPHTTASMTKVFAARLVMTPINAAQSAAHFSRFTHSLYLSRLLLCLFAHFRP